MKALFRKVFSPILRPFESGEDEYVYKQSHRTILIVVGFLFSVLSVGGLVAAITLGQYAGLIPVIVFFALALTCFVIGTLGSDRAVSKISGNR